MTGSCQSCDIYKPWTNWKQHNLGATTRLFCSISWFSWGLSSRIDIGLHPSYICYIQGCKRAFLHFPPFTFLSFNDCLVQCADHPNFSLIFPSLEKDVIPPTKYALACFQIFSSLYEILWKTSVASYCTANPSLSLKLMFRYGNTIIIIVLIDVMPQIKVRLQDRENCGF